MLLRVPITNPYQESQRERLATAGQTVKGYLYRFAVGRVNPVYKFQQQRSLLFISLMLHHAQLLLRHYTLTFSNDRYKSERRDGQCIIADASGIDSPFF